MKPIQTNATKVAIKRHGVGRRVFLKGVGVTMALPWLESLPVWGATTESASAAATEQPQLKRRPAAAQ